VTDAPALAVEDIVAGYGGVPVLDGVSVTARPATITAVLGANGAGKTTLLRTISGFVRPRRGKVLVGGTDLARRRPEDIARAGVAHVPEGQGVITELTVEENLRVGALTTRDRARRAAALADAYRRFPVLAERKRRAAATLSGGERQIAQVMDLIRQLRDEAGLTVLLVEQNARSALGIADTGLVLNLGRVVAEDDAATLAADVGLRRHYLGF